MIHALDLYVRHGGWIDDRHADVIALSEVLNSLPLEADERADDRYRNPNGVSMKLANFARLDPSYSGSGLTRGGQREEDVWARYSGNREEYTAWPS